MSITIETAGAGGEAMKLDELTKLEAAMTPGPWAGGNTADIFVDSDGAKTGERGTHVCDCDPSGDKTFAEARADRNGIVALRNAAPALIECAELLRAARAAVHREAWMHPYERQPKDLLTDIDAALARLKGTEK